MKHWTIILITLFLLPIVYALFRVRSGDKSFHLDLMIIAAISWASAVAILLWHFFA
jgi:hypothetical protein